MPDKYTKAQIISNVRASNPKAAAYTDDEVINRFLEKRPEFKDRISDLVQEQPPKTMVSAPKEKFPMAGEVISAAVTTPPSKKQLTPEDEYQSYENKRRKAESLESMADAGVTMQPGQLYVPQKMEESKKYLNEASLLRKEADSGLKSFEDKYTNSAEYKKLLSDAEKNIQKFTMKDRYGDTIVDEARVRAYVRNVKPQSANTQFEDYLQRKIVNHLDFTIAKPSIYKRVEENAKKENIKLPEGWNNLNQKYLNKASSVQSSAEREIARLNSEANNEITGLNSTYKQLSSDIDNKYKDENFVRNNFASAEELNNAYKAEKMQAFEDYSRAFSTIKSKFNGRASKLQSDYKNAISGLEKESEKDFKTISDLTEKSVKELFEQKQASRLGQIKLVGDLSRLTGAQPAATKIGMAFTGAAAEWLKNLGENLSMGNDWEMATRFRDVTANLAKKLENPQLKEVNSVKELFSDLDSLLVKTTVDVTRMLPGVLGAVGAATITGGTGAIPILASGTIGWLDEAAQARASNYTQLIEKGIDPEEARQRSGRTYAGYLATMPLSMVESAAMLGKLGGGSFLRRYITGSGAELISETPQETIQSEIDDSIINNRSFDFGRALAPSNLAKTAINVAPATFVMSGPGAAIESSVKGERFSRTADWVSRIATAPINSMAKNVLQNGLYANDAVLEAMRHNGMITEEGMVQLKAKNAEIASDIQLARTSGLNKKQQSTYAVLAGNVRSLEEAKQNIMSADMTEESKKSAIEQIDTRINNAKEAASDFLNTKNGNYAQIMDSDGDTYIVSHDELSEMLEDDAFSNDVKSGSAKVQLYYNNKANQQLGQISKRLLALNKEYNSGVREYKGQDKAMSALRMKLGLPEFPTTANTIDQLIGQKGKFRLGNFFSKVNIEGTLKVENGNLIIDSEDGSAVILGRAKEFNGVSPDFIGMQFEAPKVEGPKMTQSEAKLPSLLAMYAGKINPKALFETLSGVITDIKKSDLKKLIDAYDNAYQVKEQQKQINGNLPKPKKLVEVEIPNIGDEFTAQDVASVLGMIGDKNNTVLIGKMLALKNNDFIANAIDLDDLYENNEAFRNRVEQERGQKEDRFQQEMSNTEQIPAVSINDNIIDGLGRLAQLYLNGQKTGIVFENIKTKPDATKVSQRPEQEGTPEGGVVQREGTQEIERGKIPVKKATVQADTSYSLVSSEGSITPQNRKQLNVVNNIARAIKTLVPTLDIKAFNNTEEMRIHAQKVFGSKVAGFISSQDTGRIFYKGGKPVAVYIALDKDPDLSIGHEAWHVALNVMFGNQRPQDGEFNKFMSDIDEALRDYGYHTIADSLKVFSTSPTYMQSQTYATEYLAELGGLLSSRKINLDKMLDGQSLIDRIAQFLNRLFGTTFFSDRKTPDILKVMISLSNDMNKGMDISMYAQPEITSSVDEGISSEARNPSSEITESKAKQIAKNTEDKTVGGNVQPSMIIRGKEKGQDVIKYSGASSLSGLRTASPKIYISRANQLSNSPLIKSLVKKKTKKQTDLEWADSVYDIFKGNVISNLLSVYDSIPQQVRDISKLWYDGANIIAQEMAKKYDISLEQASAVIASQSPQKPWYDNVHLAHFIIDYHVNNQDSLFSKATYDYFAKTSEAYPKQKQKLPELEKSIGKKYSDLSTYEKSVMIRYVFDNFYERRAPLRIPTGHIVGTTTSMSSFSGYDTIGKAISILEDGSDSNISNNIGNAFKVRNFYNNIASPKTDNEVTIDTHAMAVGYMLPLGSSDPEVQFDEATYAIFAEAYREAAKQRGILAREMQSITWEGARALFPQNKKVSLKNKIRGIWDDFSKGNITFAEAQKQVKENGEDLGKTDWAKFSSTILEEGGSAPYIGELLGNGRNFYSTEQGGGVRIDGGIPTMEQRDRETDGEITTQARYATPTRTSFAAVEDSRLSKIIPAKVDKALKIKELLAKGVSIWQQTFTSYGTFGKAIFVAKEYKEGLVGKEVDNAKKYTDKFVAAAKKANAEGFNIQDADVTKYLEGDKTAMNAYPSYLTESLDLMRQHIDQLTDKLIAFGVIDDQETIDLFKSNKGKYLGRYYDLYINGKGVTLENITEKIKNVDDSVVIAAKNAIRQEVKKTKEYKQASKGRTLVEQSKILENMVNDQITAILDDRENMFVKKRISGSINVKSIIERQDIKPEIRALMGEVTSPVVRYYSTVTKMVQAAAGMRYLNQFYQEARGKFLFDKDDPNRPSSATYEISTDKNPNLGPLAGMYTWKEFAEELSNNTSQKEIKKWNEGINKAYGATKYLKTVANPGTHLKNVISNVLIFINNGYIGKTLLESIVELSANGDIRNEVVSKLKESGTIANNLELKEIQSFVKENRDLEDIINDKFKNKTLAKKGFEKVKGFLSGAYQLEDDIFKVLAFMVEAKRYSKDMYGVEFSELSTSQKESVYAEISERVKSIMPAFPRVPPFVKGMNRYLFLGSFMSFSAEAVRIEKNNMMLAIKELSNERTRATGAKRLAGMVTLNTIFAQATASSALSIGALATGGFTYFISALKALFGDDEEAMKAMMEKEKHLRMLVRDFSVGSDLFIRKAENGILQYIDIGAYHPFGFRHKIMNRFDQLTRDDDSGVISDAANAFAFGLKDYLEPDFAAKAFIDYLYGRDKYGMRTYNSGDHPVKQQVDRASNLLVEAFAPGFAKNLYDSRSAYARGEDWSEPLLNIIVRTEKIDIAKVFNNRFNTVWEAKLYDAKRHYNDSKKPGNSEEEIMDAYLEAVRRYKLEVKDIRSYVDAALDFGTDPEVLMDILKNKIGNDKVVRLIRDNAEAEDYTWYIPFK